MSNHANALSFVGNVGKAMLWKSGLRLGKLSGLQRFLVSALGAKPDKIAFALGEHTTLMPTFYNIRPWDYLNDPQLAVELEIKFCKEFGVDADISGTGTYIKFGCGPEMGTEWRQTGQDMPGCVGRLVKGKGDVAKITVPEHPTGYFKNYLQEVMTLNEKTGGEVYLTSRVLSPFSAACFLRGFQEVVIDAQTEPDFYKGYMDKCVALSLFWGKHVLETGVTTAALLEIYGTPDLVGAKFRHEHIVPYNDRVCQHFRGRVRDSTKYFIGDPGDVGSQKRARAAYDAMFEREGPEKLEKATTHRLPGMPPCLALNGETLLEWTKEDILAYLKDGLDLMVGHRVYPYVFLLSIPPGIEADKLWALREFLDGYEI